VSHARTLLCVTLTNDVVPVESLDLALLELATLSLHDCVLLPHHVIPLVGNQLLLQFVVLLQLGLFALLVDLLHQVFFEGVVIGLSLERLTL